MRLLHLAKNLNPGGITSYLFELLPTLVQQGHEVYLVSSGGEKEKFFTEKGVYCVRGSFGTRSEVNPKVYAEIPKLLRLIREKKIDCIHAHTRVTQVLAFFLSLLSKKPFITTVHGFYKKNWSRQILPAFGKRAIAISLPVADSLRAHYPALQDCVQVIPNSMDVEGFFNRVKSVNREAVCQKFGLNPKAVIVGFVGRLEKVKGGEVLLAAAVKLLKENPSTQIVFAGEGKERSTWEELVGKENLSHNVFFLGNVEAIHEIYAVLDIFVYPVLWEEGFGLSVLEAMSAQKPVIVSATGALPSLVIDQVSGMIIPKNDAIRLAEALKELTVNKEKCVAMGQKGFERAKANFSIHQAAKDLERVYDSVIRQ